MPVDEIAETRGGADGDEARRGVPGVDDLLRGTRRRLLELTHPLRSALQGIIRATSAPPSTTEEREQADAPHKFDLGVRREDEVAPATIPWSYGHDRVTAMVVDPDRMYVYWEATDEAIARARGGLGPGGADAWLDLRVYDVSGRLFDGTNAHGYFDHRVERGDRQWFFHIGKPGSTVCVELGMRSSEGYFVRIARSGRVDFPRRDPVEPGAVEWLTVRAATGPIEHAGDGAARPAGRAAPRAEGGAFAGHEEAATVARDAGEHVIRLGGERVFAGHWDWREVTRVEWVEGGQVVEWIGPVTQTTWEAGPFEVAAEVPRYVEEHFVGKAWGHFWNGKLHVVSGPWEVVIRGIGGHAEGRVVAVWELHRSWVASGGTEVRSVGTPAARALGASEALAPGASERRWLRGSAERLGGASEIHRIGASELRFRGASELRFRGASEIVFAGASEWRAVGASEWRMRGASEWIYGGASERRLGGASELRGASEWRAPGASEGRIGAVVIIGAPRETRE